MFGELVVCPEVQGKPLVLKPYEKESLKGLFPWLNDREVMRWLGTNFGFTLSQEGAWYDKVADNPNCCQWGIFWDDVHIGNAGLDGIAWVDRNASYGILIADRNAWGKGIATMVARAVAGYGFNVLDLHNIYANVFVPNIASRKALEKVGYKKYGLVPKMKFVDGAYYDCWQGYINPGMWRKNQEVEK
jgi:RimJ/RimL family protein N-acetyltransferase